MKELYHNNLIEEINVECDLTCNVDIFNDLFKIGDNIKLPSWFDHPIYNGMERRTIRILAFRRGYYE